MRISDWSADVCSSDLLPSSYSRVASQDYEISSDNYVSGSYEGLDARSAPAQPAMRAIFIRHGESTGTAGVPCLDLATIALTERGHEQARAVAARWTQAPPLIVTSPQTPTRQNTPPPLARSPTPPVAT